MCFSSDWKSEKLFSHYRELVESSEIRRKSKQDLL